MGKRVPAPAPAAHAAWIARLETDPAWSKPLRIEQRTRACETCELVLIVARAVDYPKTARRYHRVGDYFTVAATVNEYLDTPLPVSNLAALRIAEPRDHAHAVILEQAHGVAIRFRVPSV